MLKYSQIIDLPVISQKEGVKKGVVKDVIFDKREKKFKGIKIKRKSYEFLVKVVEREDIININSDSLIINKSSSIRKMRRAEFEKVYNRQAVKIGFKIFSRSGEEFGIIKDILFNFEHGSLEGVEATDGFIQDIIEGRNVIPIIGNVEFAEEQMIVDKQSLEEIINSGKGLKKYL